MYFNRVFRCISEAGAAVIAVWACLTSTSFGVLAITKSVHKPTVERAQQTNNAGPKILLGDSVDMERLSNSDSLLGLQGNPRFGLYLHETGVVNLWKKRQSVPDISISKLVPPSNQVAEFTIPLLNGHLNKQVANDYFDGTASAWNIFFLGQGLNPTSCNINGLDVSGRSQTISDWTSYAEILAKHGLRSCGTFGDPNNDNNDIPVFSDPFWDFYKNVALVMGGVALDTPPTYALNRGNQYLRHVVDVVKWARSKSLRVSIVMAAYNDSVMFKDNLRKYIYYLKRRGAVPTEWVVGGYEDGHNNKEPILHLSSTLTPLSLNGSARWLLDND